MLNKLQNDRINAIIFAVILIMIPALFLSRAVLSISTVTFFFLLSFFHPEIKSHLRKFVTTPLLWGTSFLFFFPLLSGCWSSDQQQWLQIVMIKAPLLLLPLAFAGPFTFTIMQWKILTCWFIVVMTLAMLFTVGKYMSNQSAIDATYLQAKTMITPLGNDHVRFSWLIAMTTILSGWLAWRWRPGNKWISGLLALLTCLFILFLHLLAARTGLLSLYMAVVAGAIWLIVVKAKWSQAFGLIFILVLLPLVAYFTLPSFQNRVKFIRYDHAYFKDAHYLPGSSDAVRRISWQAGWHVMNNHPLHGTGFGDIRASTDNYYTMYYPAMTAHDSILPSNEWLIYGSGTGWPGLLLVCAVVLIPFFMKTHYRFGWWILNATIILSFLVDIPLEIQFGVFVYCFPMLIFWKYQQQDGSTG